tara:strand:- start:2222 stop:2482 length:261 start_codon:yes stop_codon:yes gene_type:complete
MLQDYSAMEQNLKEVNKNYESKQTFPALILLLEDAKKVLFPKGQYKKLKWHHFGRLWSLGKITIRLINTLMGIFNPRTEPTPDELK